MTKRTALNIVAYDWSTQIISYAWRFWAARTDFYLIPRYAPLSGAKISLHGPNEQHDSWFYKLGINRSGIQRAIETGGVTSASLRGMEFEGRFIQPGVRHVLTLRWTPGLFKAGYPSAPNPDQLTPGSLGHIVAAPAQGFAADVDFYVAQDRPYWRDEARALWDRARLGPLRNHRGEYLTAVSVRRRLRDKATPREAILPSPLSKKDFVRAIGFAVDDEGVLWVVEQWTSAKFLQASLPAPEQTPLA